MPLILNEDKALRDLLKGLTVADEKNATRVVEVWFGQPDLEVRQQSYPYMTIDLIDVLEDTSRSHQGVVPITYVPEGYTADPEKLANQQYATEMPIPLVLDYQITTYARQPRHDRQIISSLLQTKFPYRRGVLEIVEDDTYRPVFLTSYIKRDMTEQGKRLFRNMFNIRVFSEMFPSEIAVLAQVSTVNLSVNYSVDNTAPTNTTFTTI